MVYQRTNEVRSNCLVFFNRTAHVQQSPFWSHPIYFAGPSLHCPLSSKVQTPPHTSPRLKKHKTPDRRRRPCSSTTASSLAYSFLPPTHPHSSAPPVCRSVSLSRRASPRCPTSRHRRPSTSPTTKGRPRGRCRSSSRSTASSCRPGQPWMRGTRTPWAHGSLRAPTSCWAHTRAVTHRWSTQILWRAACVPMTALGTAYRSSHSLAGRTSANRRCSTRLSAASALHSPPRSLVGFALPRSLPCSVLSAESSSLGFSDY